MKKILFGSAAAVAMAGIASPAAAETELRHYANPTLGATGSYDAPYNFGETLGIIGNELGLAFGIGTRYTADADAPNDTVPAVNRIDVEFTLSGTVNQDCSFYAGNNASARNIDFGVIGIRTGNNENVNDAFEMVGPAEAEIETLTAGCNTNNVVEINKDDIRGLVNANPGGYDTNEFQANIPYYVNAAWTGVALNSQTTGTPQSLSVATNANAAQKQQGAWRSDMQIDIVAPAVNGKGLVAGSYTGKTTITLRAI